MTRCRVFGLFCEDSEDEIQRRQQSINDSLGIQYEQLEGFAFASGKGEDNELIKFEGGSGEYSLTHRFHDLIEQIRKHQAKLVILDTAADTFGGNENDRRQVRRFIGTALARLARDINGAVLLNAHPSRSGLKGDMDGGSTGWSNSVRSRWSLERPGAEDKNTPDADTRVLTRRKANYAQIGEVIRLTWRQGLLVPTNMAMTDIPNAQNRRLMAQEKFMKLLAKCTAANMMLSDSNHSGNYAPKKFAGRLDADGFSAQDFEGALKDLLVAERIEMKPYGRKGDARFRIAAVDDGAQRKAFDR